MIGLGLDGYEPDSGHESAIAFVSGWWRRSSIFRRIPTVRGS